MNDVILRSPNRHALNNDVVYSELKTKKPESNTEISKENAASGSVSLQFPRTLERTNPHSPPIAKSSSVFWPPNSHTNNDTVMHGVAKTKRPAMNAETTRVQYPQQSHPSEHILPTDLARSHNGEDNAGFARNCHTATISEQETPAFPHRLSAHESGIHSMTESKPEVTRYLNLYESTARQAIDERWRIRALRRESQIRYRKKKHDYMLRLEAEAKILRQQIKNLTQQRSYLSTVVSTQDNVWGVAVDYFKCIRFGLQADGHFSTNSTFKSSQLCHERSEEA